MNLHQDFLLLLSLLWVISLNEFFEVFKPIGDVLEVLKNELTVDDLHISDGIDRVFSVCDFFIFEGADNVVNAIDVSDVAKEVVSEPFSLGGTSHDTCDINNLKHCGYFGFRLEHLAEFLESVVWDGDYGFVGLYGAEGVVFGWDVEIGEDVIGGGFADIRESYDSHAEGVAGATPQDLLILLLLILLGRHGWLKFDIYKMRKRI